MKKHFGCPNNSAGAKHYITSSELAVLPGWAVGHNTFDLQEFFLVVVTANDGEAEAPRRLDQAGPDELPLQLGGVAGEHHTRIRSICRLGKP